VRLGTICFCALLLLTGLASPPAEAKSKEASFAHYLDGLWPAAHRAGVSRKTFEAATKNLTPDPEVLEKAEKQPEFKLSAGEYMARLVSEERIEDGKAALKREEALFDSLEKRYGVSRYILAAIWGVESQYGAKPGRHNVIRALATLGYTGRRRSYGRKQLIAALRILQHGDVTLENMTGSWAGAMGHTQFIPTTYNGYAVDFTGNGKRDIWGSPADALASAAHYLKAAGWRSGESWGYEVEVPEKLSPKLISRRTAKTAAAWQKLGVKRVRGQPFPRATDRGHLFAPEGKSGPAFLVIRNFSVLKHYNNADIYALAVGHLADRLTGTEPLSRQFPSASRKVSEAD
jgi:membrane-bound lytic murein transglycosylase B